MKQILMVLLFAGMMGCDEAQQEAAAPEEALEDMEEKKAKTERPSAQDIASVDIQGLVTSGADKTAFPTVEAQPEAGKLGELAAFRALAPAERTALRGLTAQIDKSIPATTLPVTMGAGGQKRLATGTLEVKGTPFAEATPEAADLAAALNARGLRQTTTDTKQLLSATRDKAALVAAARWGR